MATPFTVRFGNGGMLVDDSGQQTAITGASKAAQDLAWTLLSPFDPLTGQGNRLFDDLGRLIPLAASPIMGEGLIRSYIEQATNGLISLQASDQNTPDTERIDNIKSLTVSPIAGSVTNFQFRIVVSLADGSDIDLALPVLLEHISLPS